MAASKTSSQTSRPETADTTSAGARPAAQTVKFEGITRVVETHTYEPTTWEVARNATTWAALDGKRVELGMAQHPRRAARRAARYAVLRVAATVAAKAGQGPPHRFVGRRDLGWPGHGVSRSQGPPARTSRARMTASGSISLAAAKASSSASSAVT